MRVFTTIIFILVSTTIGLSQRFEFPDYHSPLGIPLVLSANFGELRPNHFHMGVDFKTNGKTGYNLYSIDDGYIARVKMSPYGYGKVIYINHPNGITSVYAHCSELKGSVDSLVRSVQYETENYEVDIYLHPSELSVKKGDVIALSGNTGSSTAPHLHFELRDTETEHCLNPLVFGFDIADHISPEIRKIKAFSINQDACLINGKTKEVTVNSLKGGYTIYKDTLKIPANFTTPNGGIGLAFDIIDRLDGASNQCGLYGTYLIIDKDTLFGQRTDEISFDATRFINSHRDMSALNNKYHKSFRNKWNPLEIYINDNLGIIKIKPGESKDIELIAYDPKGNESRIKFVLMVENGQMSTDYLPNQEQFLYPDKPLIQQGANWIVETPAHAIYEPTPIVNSSNAHFCEASVLMQEATVVKLKLENPTLDPSKYYIAVVSGRRRALETKYENGWLIAESKYAGTFSIQTDINPPTIRSKTTSKSRITSASTIEFYITESETSIVDYDLYVDGEWHLLEYETKGDILVFNRPKELIGEHHLTITAIDSCGNETKFEQTLLFQ